MCGICGYITSLKQKKEPDVIKRMAQVINHRGPDDTGFYNKSNDLYEISFAHKRLSILDLSEQGHQPMSFGKYTIVFNGEVYNYQEIKKELSYLGHTFYSNTDTEVILHSFAQWGKDCVSRFIGMFAIAIYDSSDDKVYFCRDRAGVKPFYYYKHDSILVFGSELKSIMQHSYVKRDIDYSALTCFFEFGYIPKDQCIIQGVRKLEAGCWLTYDILTDKIDISRYWDIQTYYNKPKLNISYEEAKAEMLLLCKSAFKYRLVSDVPVGLALSGGYDSSLVASILVKELGINLNTFTIGFIEGNDETDDAHAISQHLGTNHTSYCCTHSDVIDLVSNLQFFYDEPFADNSAIPTILVSKLAKEKVKVLLSADGGDEIFAGYTHYDTCLKGISMANRVPNFLRPLMSEILACGKNLTPETNCRTRNMMSRFSNLLKEGVTFKNFSDNVRSYPGEFLKKYNESLGRFDIKELYSDLQICDDSLDYLLMKDYKFFMKDDVLVKVDRATMSVSLEGREPMLDHRISEFAAQLPLSYKYDKGCKKRIVKDLVHGYVPKTIMDKPKRGFSMPISDWLRGPLKDYMMESLSPQNMSAIGFDHKEVNRMLSQFLNKSFYYEEFVWRLIQYQQWFKTWI